jgi:diadenosine tetraphosphate (Ap4A) HIT family hydrolase
MLLDLNRHAQGPADLAGDEAHEFGAVMGAAMRAVRTATGVPRVYSVMFGETAAHLHAHLIPRDPSCAATKAWAVADWYREVARNPELATSRDSIVEMTRAIARAGAHELNLFA